MTGALYYPPADRSQWYGNGNATVSPNKLCWHSTETPGGWPAYGGGTMAPNLTYDPWIHKWRQHFPLNGTARALRNGPGGYSTNRKGVCQVEVSCYCDPARFGSGRGVDRLDAQAYDDMGRFAEFMRTEWGVPAECNVTLKPYPSSYGANGVRLSAAGFEAYRGHLCHMHVPYNDHGDAGSMDIHRIVAAAVGGPTQPPEEDEDMSVFLASTVSEWDGKKGDPTSPDGVGGKICLVGPKGVVWLSPGALNLVWRVVSPRVQAMSGSPFFYSELEDLSRILAGAEGDSARNVELANLAASKDAPGVTVEQVSELLVAANKAPSALSEGAPSEQPS